MVPVSADCTSLLSDGFAASVQLLPEVVQIEETVPGQLNQHYTSLHAELSSLAYMNFLHQADFGLTCLFLTLFLK